MARFWQGDDCPRRAAPLKRSRAPSCCRASTLERDRLLSLRDVGIERVAQLVTKPRASLRLRFGAELLLRLDQAFGNANEALPSLIPADVPRVEVKFAEPVGDPEDLKRIIEKLCTQVAALLEARGIGARRLDLVFLRVDNIAQAARVGLSRPTPRAHPSL